MTSSGCGLRKGFFSLLSSDDVWDGDADADLLPRPGSSAARTGLPLRKGTMRNSNWSVSLEYISSPLLHAT